MTTTQPALPSTTPTTGFTVWQRKGHGKWKRIGNAETEREALDLLRGSGSYTIQPSGRDPNDDEKR